MSVQNSASREHAARVRTAASTLRIDAATAEVMADFAARGIIARLLKGRVTADWLYDDAPRLYFDADILVRPDQIPLAAQALSDLGFTATLDGAAMPSWWATHDSAWSRSGDRVCVDLHRVIPGIALDPADAWRILTEEAETEKVWVGGYAASTLALPARAMHLALHVTHHGGVHGRPLDDLERGIARCSIEVWRQAAELAARLGALDSFAHGLQVLESGRRLAAQLSIPGVTLLAVELAGSAPPPGALTLSQLIQSHGPSPRMAIVLRKLFPPPAFMRVWAPEAAHGFPSLCWAYIRRPFWVLRKAPGAGQAYLRARRNIQARVHR